MPTIGLSRVPPKCLEERQEWERSAATCNGDKRSEYGPPLSRRKEHIHLLQRQLARRADAIFCYSRFMRDCIASSLSVNPSTVALFKCGIDDPAP